MSFLYVTDENIKNYLLEKQCKLLQEYNSGKKTWVFEYSPSLFNISDNSEIGSKCYISDKLTMFM